MKYFFDTEFIESGPRYPIYLLSIGIVADDGREYYAVVDSKEVPRTLASEWVIEHVIMQLDYSIVKKKEVIAKEIVEFVGFQPEFWAYFADYDWVVLCQLYGTMMDLPGSWPMYCLDVKQLAVSLGNPNMPKMVYEDKHHALWDARETKFRYNWLMENFCR